MATGTMKWFNATKGFGFIKPDEGNRDVFIHISEVEKSGLHPLTEGQRVHYDLSNEKGKVSAINLRLVP